MLSEDQIRVLLEDAHFNTEDANSVDFISALEPVIIQIDPSDEKIHSIRLKVTSLATKHRMKNDLTKKEQNAEAMPLMVLLTDKRRVTVKMYQSGHLLKTATLNDDESYRWLSKTSLVTITNPIKKLLDHLPI